MLNLLLYALAAFVLFHFAQVTFIGHFTLTQSDPKIDVYAYLFGAKHYSEGKAIYPAGKTPMVGSDQWLSDNTFYKVRPYIYPPLLAWALQPLLALGEWPAMFWWDMIMLAAYFGTLALLLGSRENRDCLGKAGVIVLLLLAAVWGPFFLSYAVGQVTVVLFFLLVLHYRLAQWGRPVASGLVLAVIVMLKLSPALFLAYWLLRKRWTLVASAFAGIIVIVLLTGIEYNLDFFTRVMPHLAWGEFYHINQSLTGLFLRQSFEQDQYGWVTVQTYYENRLWFMAWKALCASGILISLWGVWRLPEDDDGRWTVVVLICAILLFSPVIRMPDHIYLYWVFVIMICHLIKQPGVSGCLITLWGMLASCWNMGPWLEWMAWGGFLTDVSMHPSLIAVLLLWVYALVQQKRKFYEQDLIERTNQ